MDLKLLKVIGKTRRAEVILSLYERKKLNFGEISKQCEYPAVATKILKELMKHSLVKREVMQDALRRVEYKLTPIGKKIAKLLVQFRDLE